MIKSKKTVISIIIFALIMSVCCFFGTTEFDTPKTAYAGGEIVLNESPHVHGAGVDAVEFTAWDGGDGHNSMPSTEGNYVLTSDITLSTAWSVPAGTTNLCLSGHVVKQTGSGQRVIVISEGATLNISDCNETEYFGHIDATSHIWVHDETKLASGNVSIFGGYITGAKTTSTSQSESNGAGIYVNGGTLTMDSGNIVGNQCTKSNYVYGGGVFVCNSGVFTMNGGSIVGNVSTSAHGLGGGVSLDAATFNMNGGSITNNYTSNEGAGVQMVAGSTATINGGVIKNNTAGGSGGAIHVNGSNFTVGKDTVITGNVSGGSGGGVFNYRGNGIVTDNALITDNYAQANGGGFLLYDTSSKLTVGGSAVITGNKAGCTVTDGVATGGNTNNLHLRSNSKMTLGTKTETATGNGVAVPKYGMSIGITPSSSPTLSTPIQICASGSKAQAKYFTADDNTSDIAGKDNKLYVQIHSHKINDVDSAFTAWDGGAEHNYMPTTAGNYVLTSDITLSTAWSVPAGTTSSYAKTYLCLNGHVIKLQSVDVNCVIIVPLYSELYLYDCDTTSIHYFTKDAKGLWTLASDQTTPTDYSVVGGVITGGTGRKSEANDTCMGGGIAINENSLLEMYGGNIVGNTAECGAGVGLLTGGTFKMHGGLITGNSVYDNTTLEGYLYCGGGGVYNYYGNFEMSGNAEISYNRTSCTPSPTSAYDGAGIYNISGTNIISENAVISNNVSDRLAGGIYCANGIFNITGGKITDNHSAWTGGAIYAENGDFLVSDCEITGNVSGTYGGGVYISAFCLTLGGSVKIKNNVIDDGENTYPNDLGLCYTDGYDDIFYFDENNPIELDTEIGLCCYDNEMLIPGELREIARYESDISSCFFADEDYYKIIYEDGSLLYSAGGFNLCTGVEVTFARPYGTPEFYAYDYINYEDVDTGYVFDGWYTKRTGGELVSKDGNNFESPYTKFNACDVYYAHWKASEDSDIQVLTETLYVFPEGVSVGNNKISNDQVSSYFVNYGISYDQNEKQIVLDGTFITVFLEETYDTYKHYGYFYGWERIIKEGYVGAVYIYEEAKVLFKDGSIFGNCGCDYSGGVYNNGTFTMDGGYIQNNCGEQRGYPSLGGGVYNNGTFNLNGGEISYNAADDGGGVYTEAKSTFNLNGGVISYNSSRNGGGVFVAGGGDFFMDGGEISYNWSNAGAGVCVELGGAFIATKGIITENVAHTEGGGVYVSLDYLGSDPILYCLAEGTPITLKNGQKVKIENLKVGDEIRVFDHETGEISSSKIFNLQRTKDVSENVIKLNFTNDISVTIVGGHSFYNKEENKYVVLSPSSASGYIGKEFYNADLDRWEKLLSVEAVTTPVDSYSIVTEKTLNSIANGMLSSGDELYYVLINIFDFDEYLKHDQVAKQNAINQYGLLDFGSTEFATRETFDALNLKYLPIALGKGLITYEQLTYAGEYQQSHDTRLVRHKPGIFLGGSIEISGNYNYYSDPFEENLALWNEDGATIITLGTGEEGNKVEKPSTMKVGITVLDYDEYYGDGIISLDVNSDDAKYFFADNPEQYCFFEESSGGDPSYLIVRNIVKYDIYVAGVQVTELNKDDILGDLDGEDATVYYDEVNNVLTLNNATIVANTSEDVITEEIGNHEDKCMISQIGVLATSELKITLIGNSRIGNIVNYKEGVTEREDYDFWFGVRSFEEDSALTFTGNGSLTIYDAFDGISSSDEITFDQNFKGTITVYDVQFEMDLPPCAISAFSDINILGGKFDLTSFNSDGINSSFGSVYIKDSTVSVNAAKVGIACSNGGSITIDSSSLIVKGGLFATSDVPTVMGTAIVASESIDGIDLCEYVDANFENYHYLQTKRMITFDENFTIENVVYGEKYDKRPDVYSDGNKIYDAKFDYTYYKTSDNGETWTKSFVKPTGIGKYKVVISISKDDINYVGSKEFIFEIKKREMEIVWADIDFIFNGEDQFDKVCAYYKTVDGKLYLIDSSYYQVKNNKHIVGTTGLGFTSTDFVEVGEYTANLTTAGWNYLLSQVGINFKAPSAQNRTHVYKINPLVLDKPTNTETYVYNGSEQTYLVEENDFYTISNDKRTEVGSQTVTLSLIGNALDSVNVTWNDGSIEDLDLTFEIEKAIGQITLSSVPSTQINGETIIIPTATSNFGQVVCDKKIEDITEVGTYVITYSLEGTDNYSGDVKTFTLTIKNQEQAKGLCTGAIIAIIVGGILLLLIIIYLLGYFFLYRKGKLDDKKIRVIYKILPRGEKKA